MAVLLTAVAPVKVTPVTPTLSLTLTVKVTVSVFSEDDNKVTLVIPAVEPFFLPILVILGLASSVLAILTVIVEVDWLPAASEAVRVKFWLTVP